MEQQIYFVFLFPLEHCRRKFISSSIAVDVVIPHTEFDILNCAI